MPAQRLPRGQRDARGNVGNAEGVRRIRPAHFRRRLLRHHAGPQPRDCRSSRRRRATQAVSGAGGGRMNTTVRHTRLSGLEPLVITPELLFVNVGERTNVTGSAKFKKLTKEDRFDEEVEVERQQVANGAQIIDVNMDEGMIDSAKAKIGRANA